MIALIYHDPSDSESVLKAEKTQLSIQKKQGWESALTPKMSRDYHIQSQFKNWMPDGKIKSHENKIEKYPEEEAYFYRSFINYQIEARTHLLFWQRVVSTKKPMAFIEAGMHCYGDWEGHKVHDCLMLNFQHAFDYPTQYEKYYMYTPKNRERGTHRIEERYPLKNSNENVYKGSRMIAGIDSYVITPRGAKKLLEGVNKYGLDQASHNINTNLVDIDYLFPSAFRYDTPDLLINDGTRLP